jgi:hypothetical protein
VALFPRIFAAVTGDSSDVVIVLSTLLLAGAFAPLRKALENFVDGHFKPRDKAAPRPVRRRRPRVDPRDPEPDNLAGELRELRLRMAHLEGELAGIGEERRVGSSEA